MKDERPSEATPGIGIVLAGGAARGAYQVGVLEHLVTRVADDLGRDVPLDILCGTSVGAMNACMMAAHADQPRGRAAHMVAVWTSLQLDDLLRPAARSMFDVARGILGRGTSVLEAGALLDPTPLADLLQRSIPFERIDTHLRSGRLRAVTVTTTQLTTGRAVVFVQRRRAHPAPWPDSHQVAPRAVRLRAIHTLASAAVPLLFPAVRIDGRYYSDGGLKQNVPLSPARRLGARALIVINPKHAPPPPPSESLHAIEEGAPSALFLLGKTLNALLVDRIDNELDRFEKINAILEAGERRYGDGFADTLNTDLGYEPGAGLQNIDVVHIRSSVNIPKLAAEFVRDPRFHFPGVLGRVMKRLAHDETISDADLLSYVLFDGEFAGRLIEIGRMDAAAHHERLCRLVDTAIRAHEERGADRP
ncbi:MAG: patatin-like phospholipase family protein [Deltaproteobacteria bacterium]|nr:patatin-like phospholipase family protein [Deltaproteobacteria bacterium]